jgi:hypothetical protein
MACKLVPDPKDTFPGTTLYSPPRSSCPKQTSVYRPPNAAKTNKLNVIVWLHGFYVNGDRFLFQLDDVMVRQRVLSSGRDVVLIAPYLGYGYFDKNGDPAGDFDTSDLGTPKWGENYFTEVLKGIAKDIDPKSPPDLDIKNLILACHSGAGSGMRGMVDTLGKFLPVLRECWGFDCLYGRGDPRKGIIDDANFWFNHSSSARPLFIFFGPTTIPQSVKLLLMGKGLADGKGNRFSPPGPGRPDIHVAVGRYDAFPLAGQMVEVGSKVDAFADSLLTPPPLPTTTPAPRAPRPPDGDFVRKIADNFDAKFAFPPGIHYTIARKYLESLLRNAKFK